MTKRRPLQATDLRGVVFDGAMGTLLQQRGLSGGEAGEVWNVERPDAVLAAHREYVAAGADVLTSNTFGASLPRLEMHGLGVRVFDLNSAGARLARQVADETEARTGRRVLVAGGLGPTGELIAPLGELTQDGASILLADQLACFARVGIDLVLVETLSDLAELRAVVQACRTAAPGLPVVATMSFDTNLHTMMGVSPAAAVQAGAELGLLGVGANCGRGPEEMELIMAQMVSARDDLGIAGDDGPVVIAQSNAGMPRLDGDRFVYDADPHVMAGHAGRLRGLGVDAVGACCGSTPDHIAAIARVVKE